MFAELRQALSFLSRAPRQRGIVGRSAGRLRLGIEHLETRVLPAGLSCAGAISSTVASDGDAAAPIITTSAPPVKVVAATDLSQHAAPAADRTTTNRNTISISSTPTNVQQATLPIAPPQQPGDYNLNGVVDAADYSVWRDSRGAHVTPFTGADGDGDGFVDESDYEVWTDNFGLGHPYTAPTITSAAPSVKPAAETDVSFQVTASGNPFPSFSLIAAPDGMSIGSDSGLITWTPTTAQEGPQSVTVAATNSRGQATQTFSLTVIPKPPTGVTATGASTTSIALSWNASADPNVTGYNVYERTFLHNPKGSGGTFHYHLLSSNQPATTFVATGLTAGSGHTYLVTAISSTLGLASGYSTAVGGQTWVPPTLQPYYLLSSGAVFSGPINVSVGQTVQITLLGTGNPPVVYSALNGPSNVSVDPMTGVVTYTPDDAEVGLVSVTFQAENVLGAVMQTFQFNVT